MKPLLLLMTICAVPALFCKLPAPSHADPNTYRDTTLSAADNSLNGDWVLIPVLPSDSATGRLPRLHFDAKTSRFGGNTGCNAMGGSYRTSGSLLSFGKDMITTKMACPGYNERPFMESLLHTNNFEIKQRILYLRDSSTVLSSWSRPGAPKDTIRHT